MKHRYLTIFELRNAKNTNVNVLELLRYGNMLKVIFFTVFIGLMLFILSCLFVPWVQTVRGSGKVIAYHPDERQQSIDATVDGRISKWHVQEGTLVEKDQPIVELIDIDPNMLERMNLEKSSLQNKLDAFNKSLLTSESNLERQRKLERKGLSSQRSVELAEIENAKFKSEVATVQAELAKIENRISRQSNQTILAPRAGTILKIMKPQGNVIVKSGESLASFVPKSSKRAVELVFSGNDISLVSIGRKVRIQFEGWPAIQFSGWPSKAIGTFGGEVAIIDQSDNGNGKFRIIVFDDGSEIWPDEIYLRQGVQAIGWVQLDQVSLGWELWRQFNAFPPSVKTASEIKNEK